MGSNLYCAESYLPAIILHLILLFTLCTSYRECDPRPKLNTDNGPLQPDSRYAIEIIGIDNNKYIPSLTYQVRLFTKDNQSTFMAFTISLNGDEEPNEKNPRRPILLQPGQLRPSSKSKLSPICENTIIQSDMQPKTSVEVTWVAPPKGNKCVTVYALLGINSEVQYSNDGPLSKRVCEDRRKAEDMQPTQNNNCNVCEDARYQLVFEGVWSYNTHSQMFPQDKQLARFSDVVGASHDNNFNVYKFNLEASEGLEMLAAQGNTTKLEMEIQAKLGTHVRTIIKATGQPMPNMSTTAIFRVSRKHHLVSLVSAILPSPDWFLGVSNFELCDFNNQWTQNATLNLYPMDAGTDSGLTFESPNEETSPPKPISATVFKDVQKEQMKPFAKLRFYLIRTYKTSECSASETRSDNSNYGSDINENTSTTFVESKTKPPPPLDTKSTSECRTTEWDDWMECIGECKNNTITGIHTRLRYPIIDGVVIKYGAETDKLPDDCFEEEFTQVDSCTEPCEDKEEVDEKPLVPGGSWYSSN